MLVGHRAVDRHNSIAPVEVRKVVEEALKDVERGVKILVEIVQQECHKDIECVGGHIRRVGPQECCIESQPTL